MLRLAPLALLVTACVVNLPGASPPPITSGGTQSCREIMETCDNTCQTPDCVQSCTARGTPEAQQTHSALISCGQQNFCTNEDCMREKCGGQIDACQASGPSAPPPPPPPANSY